MFYPGQKVVCVVAIGTNECAPGCKHLPNIKKGEVHTVAEVFTSTFRKMQGLSLVGLEDPDAGYAARCFRPLTERSTETGMSILRKIAEGQPVQEGVGV